MLIALPRFGMRSIYPIINQEDAKRTPAKQNVEPAGPYIGPIG
jgi:hypothetical protein